MDDNYTKFPNDILDAAIKSRFTATQLTAILYVVRKVNGWGKPCDRISVTKMAQDAGYTREAMSGAISDLEKMGVLSIERHGRGKQSEMRVNDPEYWDQPVNGSSHQPVNGGSQVSGKSVLTTVHMGVNGSSHQPVNGGSHKPVNCGSHTKEKKERKDINQKKGADPTPGGVVQPDEAEDDDDGMTPDEAIALWLAEQKRGE